MFVPNHLHLIVKGYINNPPKEEEVLNNWFRELIEKVRMKVIVGPTSIYVDDKGNEGLTGTVVLATSHSSFHCWDAENPAMFQFDLYSCSEFTAQEVLDHLDKFGLTECNYILIDRNNAKMVIIEEGSK